MSDIEVPNWSLDETRKYKGGRPAVAAFCGPDQITAKSWCPKPFAGCYPNKGNVFTKRFEGGF